MFAVYHKDDGVNFTLKGIWDNAETDIWLTPTLEKMGWDKANIKVVTFNPTEFKKFKEWANDTNPNNKILLENGKLKKITVTKDAAKKVIVADDMDDDNHKKLYSVEDRKKIKDLKKFYKDNKDILEQWKPGDAPIIIPPVPSKLFAIESIDKEEFETVEQIDEIVLDHQKRLNDEKPYDDEIKKRRKAKKALKLGDVIPGEQI